MARRQPTGRGQRQLCARNLTKKLLAAAIAPAVATLALSPPASKRLTCYEVRVEGNDILVGPHRS